MPRVPAYKNLTPSAGGVIYYASAQDAPDVIPNLVRQVSTPANITQAHLSNCRRVRLAQAMKPGIAAYAWAASSNPAYRDASITTTGNSSGVRSITLRGGYATTTTLPAVCFTATSARVILFLPEVDGQPVFKHEQAMLFLLVDGARRGYESLADMVDTYVVHLRCNAAGQLSSDDADAPTASEVARWSADIAATVQHQAASTAQQLASIVAYYDEELERLRSELLTARQDALASALKVAQLEESLASSAATIATLQGELTVRRVRKSPLHEAVARLHALHEADHQARARERALITDAVNSITLLHTPTSEDDQCR